MKKKLLLLPLAALFLASCVGPGGGGGGFDPDEERDFTIYFYLDYNHYDPDDPYYACSWYYDRPFSKTDINLKDPTEAPDPYYPTFLGWSRQALVDEEQYLWDFKTAISEEEAVGGYIELFGIFVGE